MKTKQEQRTRKQEPFFFSEAAEENGSDFKLPGVRKERAGFALVQRLFEYLPGIQRQEHIIVKGY